MAETKTKKAKEAKGARPAKGKTAKASPSPGKQVDSTDNDGGHAAAEAMRKAQLPLLAGGAAMAGVVGGVVLGTTRPGGKVLGVKLPAPKRVNIRSKDLAKAAKEIGRFGENVGDLTAELKRAREGLAEGNGHHSSPIEVLLKGLTNRR